MENRIINIDEMSFEELSVIQERINQRKQQSLEERVKALESEFDKGNLDGRIVVLEEKWKTDNVKKVLLEIELVQATIKTILEEKEVIKEELDKVKDKTNTLEFEDKDTLGQIKTEARSRVGYLLGFKGTPQYNLLFRSCVQDLYSIIGESLAGGKAIGKIKTDYGKSAIDIAKAYNLNRKKIKNFIQGLQKENEKGYLTKEKSKQLEDTIEWLSEKGIR